MRWLRDIALLVLLIGLGSGVVWWQQEKREEQAKLDKTTADTQRLEREVRFHAATKTGELNARGWPITVDPAWFELDPPQNLVVTEDRPWVEIASEEEAGLMHPRVRMTIDSQTAAFWYNPYQGVVRARVPVSMTDEQATTMYNAVNRVSIAAIDWHETPMDVPKLKQDKAADDPSKKDGEEPALASAAKLAERERPVVIVHRTTRAGRKP
jgi:hypothetical protein